MKCPHESFCVTKRERNSQTFCKSTIFSTKTFFFFTYRGERTDTIMNFIYATLTIQLLARMSCGTYTLQNTQSLLYNLTMVVTGLSDFC